MKMQKNDDQEEEVADPNNEEGENTAVNIRDRDLSQLFKRRPWPVGVTGSSRAIHYTLFILTPVVI